MADVLEIYDTYGNRGGVINGQRVSGPLEGYTGLSYTPRGACINKPGTCTFALPMTIRNNYPLVEGAMVFVRNTRWGDQGLFIVGEKSETVAENGHTASFVCTDLVEELRWVDIPGFSSLSGEALSRIYQRLLNIQDETAWTVKMQAGTDVVLYDNNYVVDGATVQQAIGQLSAAWYLKWRRGDGRVIEVGTFGRDTGIRLVKPSMRPAAMNRDTIRPIKPGGINPVTDAAGIVNCLVGLGAGNGWAQVSLRDLYETQGETAIPGTLWTKSGPPKTPWVGYDPAYPIYKRYRYDGALDGFQYFLTDATSIGRYRKRWNRLHTDIGTVSGNPLDLTAAAANVYLLTLAKLKGFSAKHTDMTITCVGRGSNVGIGGEYVHVEYQEVTRGVTTMDVNDKFIVTDCTRAVDDATGAYTDTFQASNLGRAGQTENGIVTGALQDIQSMRNAATVYPSGFPIWIDAPITPQSPIQVPWDEDRGRLATVEAIFTVTCYPVYSTVTGGQVAAHHHTATLPGRSQDASVPYKYEQSYNPGSQANYGHAENISANRSGSYGENISANKSGSVTDNIGVSKSGGINSNTLPSDGNHGHNTPIFGGLTNPNPDQNVWYKGDSSVLAVKSSGGSVATGSQTIGSNHGHSDSIGVSKGGGVQDNIGVSKGGGLQDNLGVYKGGGISQHGGFTPDSRFPGHANDLSYSQTVQTSNDIAPGFTPVYGKFVDPAGAARNITCWIDGAQIQPADNPGGVYATSFTINLTPYLQGQQGRTIEFRSETLGRLLIRGRIRTRVSIFHIGA